MVDPLPVTHEYSLCREGYERLLVEPHLLQGLDLLGEMLHVRCGHGKPVPALVGGHSESVPEPSPLRYPLSRILEGVLRLFQEVHGIVGGEEEHLSLLVAVLLHVIPDALPVNDNLLFGSFRGPLRNPGSFRLSGHLPAPLPGPVDGRVELLEHDIEVRPPEPECGDGAAPRNIRSYPLPFGRLGYHVEW